MNTSSSGGDLVTVGANTQLSFHQLQDIYNSLTGKTERIGQIFDKSYIIKFEDLEQLHARISQCCQSYGARVKNEFVVVYHISGLKEQFSSFDRFRLYNKSNTSPIENIHLEYNILIIPAGTTDAKQYRIVFDLPSRIALWEKQPEVASGSFGLMRFLGTPAGRVQIDYVDYAAARHFLAQIQEWSEALEASADRKWLQIIQRHSHLFRLIIPFLSVATIFYIFAQKFQKIEIQQAIKVDQFAQLYMVISGTLVAWLIFLLLGRAIELYVDGIQALSYISINRGDEKCVRKWKRNNIVSAILSVGGLVLAFALNILASFAFERYF